jgi:hypothetical protein
MNIQDIFDMWAVQMEQSRAKSQMTLGKMIAVLENMPPETTVAGLFRPHSYRGYYSDIAFENSALMRTVSELLQDCRDSMGRVFIGWKGGEFLMGENTPVWVAERGCCGNKLLNILADGTIITEEDE